MKLRKIKIKNVKSFRDEIEFNFHDNFNIFIGPNAGGKSNLLDVIYLGLNLFLFNGYKITEVSEYGGRITKQIGIIKKNKIYRNFEKFLGCVEDSFIEFEIALESADIKLIESIQKFEGEIINVLEREFENGSNLNFDITLDRESYLFDFNRFFKNELKIFNVKHLPIGKEIEFKFIYNKLYFSETNIDQDVAQFLHNFFKGYEILRIVSNYIENLKIPPLLMSFNPYRNLVINSLLITLSNFNYFNEYEKLFTSSSKDTINLTKFGIAHFGEKMRSLEAKSEKENWKKDEEVKLVSKYLNKFGYDWSIKLIDLKRNTYEIELTKGGRIFSIDNASSGEREIINFLFGIFAFNIKNGLIIIDEPELHLHPKWQKILLELFIELSELTGNQFIISTHSPVFINEKTYNHVFRIYKDNENVSRRATFEDIKGIKVIDLLHLVNMTNSEKIYFADAVILVEGIKDKIIFQKILDDILEEKEINKNIEIIEVRGKSNLEKFRVFLDELKIPNFFIGDLDVVTTFGDSGEIKSLFKIYEEKIYRDVIKNKKSTDGKELIRQLEKAIETCDCRELMELWTHIKYLRKEIKAETLDEEDKKKVLKFIEGKKDENIYILSKGEIEDYLPDGYRKLEKVTELLDCEEELNSWKDTPEYKELKNIMNEIIEKIV